LIFVQNIPNWAILGVKFSFAMKFPKETNETIFKFATEASKLLAAVANCSEQIVNQNTNVAADFVKLHAKEHSVLL